MVGQVDDFERVCLELESGRARLHGETEVSDTEAFVRRVKMFYREYNTDSKTYEYVVELESVDGSGAVTIWYEWLKHVHHDVPQILQSFIRYVRRVLPTKPQDAPRRGYNSAAVDNGARQTSIVEPAPYHAHFFRDASGTGCNRLAYNQSLADLGCTQQIDQQRYRRHLAATGGRGDVHMLRSLDRTVRFGAKIRMNHVHRRMQEIPGVGTYLCVAIPKINHSLRHTFVISKRAGRPPIVLDSANTHPVEYTVCSMEWVLSWSSIRLVWIR
jgi:hypothetical protein